MSEPIENMLSEAIDGNLADSSEPIECLEPSDLNQVASELVVHGLLRDWGEGSSNQNEQRIDRVMEAIGGGSKRIRRRNASRLGVGVAAGKWRYVKVASSLIGVAAALAVIAFLTIPKGDLLAATDSIDTMISASLDAADRTYRIHVVEEYSPTQLATASPKEIKPKKESVDDATLVVRGGERFVLIHSPISGEGRVSGCDGEQSWSFRNDSPIHVSSDLGKFRNSLPDHQHDLPLLNIQKHLAQLKAGYRLKLLSEAKAGRNGETLSQLTGVKKSKEVRGPREIEIWFDESAGTIHWMLLDKLPRGQGDSKSILLELVGQSGVADEFYSFQFHDDLNRRIFND
ncbi:hypothetical protein N9B31_09685 [Mariniblastus sp.]|nr:hypothetical protein [bacterium]MDA7903919.1 hypothetical protein [Mariniblastus sp.]MDA7885179.1 hypothetical protein [bacterium]MDA7901547.1 hypothetical protein [bacterium]MDA7904520.1 hypothetical protein [bacterium]